jgi:hypothetical protein
MSSAAGAAAATDYKFTTTEQAIASLAQRIECFRVSGGADDSSQESQMGIVDAVFKTIALRFRPVCYHPDHSSADWVCCLPVGVICIDSTEKHAAASRLIVTLTQELKLSGCLQVDTVGLHPGGHVKMERLSHTIDPDVFNLSAVRAVCCSPAKSVNPAFVLVSASALFMVSASANTLSSDTQTYIRSPLHGRVDLGQVTYACVHNARYMGFVLNDGTGVITVCRVDLKKLATDPGAVTILFSGKPMNGSTTPQCIEFFGGGDEEPRYAISYKDGRVERFTSDNRALTPLSLAPSPLSELGTHGRPKYRTSCDEPSLFLRCGENNGQVALATVHNVFFYVPGYGSFPPHPLVVRDRGATNAVYSGVNFTAIYTRLGDVMLFDNRGSKRCHGKIIDGDTQTKDGKELYAMRVQAQRCVKDAAVHQCDTCHIPVMRPENGMGVGVLRNETSARVLVLDKYATLWLSE